MHKILTLLLLALLLASCNTALNGDHDISGVWTDDRGNIYCLDKDGILGLPGQASISGVTWRMSHGVLQLTTMDAPGSAPSTRTLTLKSSGPRTLELMDTDGHKETWKRSSVHVGRLEGRLFYRERIALPPQVTLDVQLYPLRGGTSPVAMTLTPRSSHEGLNFRIYYLTQTVTDEMRLSAAILLDTEALFVTDTDQTISMQSQPSVMLRQALPGEYQLPSLKIPARYKGDQVELFLEDHGIALLRGPSGITLGTWMEKERNRIIEIARGELPPLRVARNSEEGNIVLTGLTGSRPMTLSPDPSLIWPDTSLFLEGELHNVDGKTVFSECNSLRDLSVAASSKGYSQLNALADKGSATVVIEGRLHDGVLDVRKVFQVHKGGICTTGQYASAPLTGTYWRLRELDGELIQTFPDQPEPHLILSEKDKASGSDGCNNFFMEWKRNGQELTFTEGGTTLRLCPQGSEQSQAMHEMFSEVNAWNISGSKLELRTDKGVAAVFEAVDM